MWTPHLTPSIFQSETHACTRMAQVWVCTHSIHACVTCCVWLLFLFDNSIHFSFLIFSSDHPVLPSARQLHLPRCGGQNTLRTSAEDLDTLAENEPPTDESTSCRGTVQSAWQYLQWDAKGGRAGLLQKGKWPPRGTGTTVLTYPCPSQPCFGGSKGCAQVTGKAGENGQYSGEMGGSSPRTRPSAPECGDTQGSSGRPASDLGWGSSSKRRRLGVAIDWVTGRSYSSARRRLNVQSGQRKGRKGAAALYPSVTVRDRGHWKGVAGSGWVRGVGRGKTARGWKGVRPGVRLESPSGEPVRNRKITSASSCRCSTTSHGGLKTIKKNADQVLNSFLSMRKRFGAGHLSFLGPGSEKKWYSISEDSPHGEMGQNSRANDVDICRKRTPSLPIHESIVQRSA